MADRQRGGPAVLVVPASSAACAEAVSAFVDGRAAVVLAAGELDLLPDALVAASHGFAVVSTAVIDGARRVPMLTEGERALLALVAGGASNDSIASELEWSMASVKREIVRLGALLAVEGRSALIGAARDLGFGD